MTASVYLIGSLRNPEVPRVAERLRRAAFSVFEEWHSAGPTADSDFLAYAKTRGWNYADALRSDASRNIFEFDKRHMEASNIGVLLLPAGRSGHLELGVMHGWGKPTYVLHDTYPTDRIDHMYRFADGVFDDVEDLVAHLLREHA